MFLAGVDGKTPELRPPSIKGAMRFWWRALHGHLTLKQLREKEARIFGGGGDDARRSSFSIRIVSDLTQQTEEKPLPHHSGDETCKYISSCRGKKPFNKDQCQKGKPFPSISSGLFCVQLNGKNINQIKSLFVLTCLLGGFGKRSRRGFGSVIITGRKKPNEDEFRAFDMPKTLNEICAIISVFNTDYRLDDADKKISLHKPEMLNGKYSGYPYIEEIQIGGEPYSQPNPTTDEKYSGFELVEFIGQATHVYFDENKSNGAGRPRFASPTYVSALKVQCQEQGQNQEECYYPIITTLHYAPPPNRITNNSVQLKENFKKAIIEKALSDN